jgi:hypothetical protein
MAKYSYHRVDANAEAILTAMEQAGASIFRGGPLDAIVGLRGDTWLVEIKTPKGKLRESQKRFLARWKGNAVVIRSVEEGLKLLMGVGRY